MLFEIKKEKSQEGFSHFAPYNDNRWYWFTGNYGTNSVSTPSPTAVGQVANMSASRTGVDGNLTVNGRCSGIAACRMVWMAGRQS
jgi:hypothetical protein